MILSVRMEGPLYDSAMQVYLFIGIIRLGGKTVEKLGVFVLGIVDKKFY